MGGCCGTKPRFEAAQASRFGDPESVATHQIELYVYGFLNGALVHLHEKMALA